MKNLVTLTFVFFICLSNVHLTEIKLRNSNLKNKKAEEKSNEKLKSKLKQPKMIYINAVGHEVESPMIVDKAPFKLDRCDQIAALEAEFVPDLEDFAKRKKAFFTISAYNLNRFEGKDIAKLDQSLVFTNSRVKPSEPLGADSCLLIDGGDYEKELLICLKDKEEFNNFRDLLDTLEDCRKGKIIGKPQIVKNSVNAAAADKAELNDVVKKCGFEEEGSKVNLEKLLKSSEEKKKEEKAPSGEIEFWIPAGENVPGVPKKR